MSSTVLARKWRPNTFETLVGQTHAVQALTHALSTQRLHHAYLFTGTHGVGKTSTARILAKALSCEKGITPSPCGTCQHCQDIEKGRFVDLLEIDAASRSKVEDTREILDNILYAPVHGRFKIYLIDEVHMLSGHSFNALLKTLEEPPAHVKFLLATTEPKKLPVTVLSRCLQFHLKNILPAEMEAHLSYILQQENICYEAGALSWIAQAANGSARDALSLLDQAIARGQNQVLETHVREMLGYVDTYHVIQLAEALVDKNVAQILVISTNLQREGIDCADILRELQRLFHQLSIIQLIPEYNGTAFYSAQTLKTLSAKISAEDLQLFYQIALKGVPELSLTPSPWIAFEMTLLRMLAFQPTEKGEYYSPLHLKKSEKIIPEKKDNCSSTSSSLPGIGEDPVPRTDNVPASGFRPIHGLNDGRAVTKKEQTKAISWESILPSLNLTGLANTAAQHCLLKTAADNQIILNTPTQYETFLTAGIKKQIEQALVQYFLENHKKSITVIFQGTQETLASPAVKQQEKEKQILSNIQTEFDKDENLHKILEVFHGTIVPDSIKQLSD